MVPLTLLAAIYFLAMAINLAALELEKQPKMWQQHAKVAEALLAPARARAEPAPALLIDN